MILSSMGDGMVNSGDLPTTAARATVRFNVKNEGRDALIASIQPSSCKYASHLQARSPSASHYVSCFASMSVQSLHRVQPLTGC